MKKVDLESQGNDLTFLCEHLWYDVPVRSYKVRSLD